MKVKTPEAVPKLSKVSVMLYWLASWFGTWTDTVVLVTEETVADWEPNRTVVRLLSVPKPVPMISTAVPAGPVVALREVMTGVVLAE